MNWFLTFMFIFILVVLVVGLWSYSLDELFPVNG